MVFEDVFTIQFHCYVYLRTCGSNDTALPIVVNASTCEVQVCHWVDSKWIVRFDKVCQLSASSGISEVQLLNPSIVFFSTNSWLSSMLRSNSRIAIFVWRPRMFASRYSSMN